MDKEKSNWYITRGTANDHVSKVVERVRTERLPVCIDEVIVFGSLIKGKLNPHDVDILLVKRKPQPDDYTEANKIYYKLIEYFQFYHDSRYETTNITNRLIRRGLKGVELSDTSHYNLSGDALLMFIRRLRDKEKILKSGFPMKVIWSSAWEKELLRDEKHPLLPYLRFMQMVNDAGVYGDMKKIDERIKVFSAYNGGDWKALLNKEEMQCYEDVIRER